MSEWQSIETAPETEWGKTTACLLYSREVGVRSGAVGRNGNHVWAHIASLHGNAVEDWGVTHWMPLPAPPQRPAVSDGAPEKTADV